MERTTIQAVKSAASSVVVMLLSSSVSAAERIEGRVEAGGAAIAEANVVLWEGRGSPRKLDETQTGDDGSFRMEYGTPARRLKPCATRDLGGEGSFCLTFHPPPDTVPFILIRSRHKPIRVPLSSQSSSRPAVGEGSS